MIEIKQLRKSYGKSTILHGIDLEINESDVVSLIGPSGSGKTTLLRCINLLEKPEAGYIRIDDSCVNLGKLNHKQILNVRRKTAMVFQNYALFANKTAGENIMEGLIVSKKMRKDEARAVAEDMLEKVGLKSRFNAKSYELSGGQQQRVGIARALALNPKVILFDEPTSALDPEMVSDILNLIKDVAKSGVTMLIVTHEMQFAYDISKRVIFLDKGEIVEQGTQKDVFDNPCQERTRQFLSRFNISRDIEFYI
ncbi:MAG: amino acid ABC transporter ATP-binding protein [Spirochaetaceae bacterium]|jgi:L-cystine transport system ATP-binding protein|nr:amino acid ABC transporter ATP-binding protein [Spirochaetaceae bacterium]